MVKNHINWLKRENLEKSINNAKTNEQKWNILKTLGANGDKTMISSCHNFDVNDLNNFYARLALLVSTHQH